MEEGDRRGEFIRAQLALEDEKLPAKERKRFKKQEQDLLKGHARSWLGGLAPFLLDPPAEADRDEYEEPEYEFRFARGWLDSLEGEYYGLNFARALAAPPQAPLLRPLPLPPAPASTPRSPV